MRIEQTILRQILTDDNYCKQVIPFLKLEYFDRPEDQQVYTQIQSFITKYNNRPNRETLEIELNSAKGLHENVLKNCLTNLDEIFSSNNPEDNKQWLVDNTEKFCQEKAIYKAMMTSLEIMAGENKKAEKGKIPELLSDALSISFDSHVGHSFLDDSKARYEYYHKKENRIPFGIDILNKVTRGGIPRKTLNVIMGGPNVGKTLTMAHFAADYMINGKNVLYISLEMAEEEIARRIDVNLLNVSFDDIEELDYATYEKRINRIKQKTTGKLVIKQYPTYSANVLHFKALLNDLKLKQNFVPDVVFIDYINIATSATAGKGSNSYETIKSIGAELRGLAIEKNVAIWTATQTTRTGYQSSDPDITDVSESFGLPGIADYMIALVSNDTLEKLKQYQVTQLKSRYNNKNKSKKFFIGVDKDKSRLYDVENPFNGVIDSATEIVLTDEKTKNLKSQHPNFDPDKLKGAIF